MLFLRSALLASLALPALSAGPPPSKHGTLAFTQTPNITTVTIQHPPTNLVDAPLVSDLHDLMLYLRATPDPEKVVIFKSANPDFFLSHIDFNLLANPIGPDAAATAAQYVEVTRFLQNITSTVFIGAINGRASGAGHEVTVQMDIRFAGPNASSGSLEDGFGGVPGVGGELFLGPLVNKGRALEYVLGAKAFDAPTGTRLGLWNDDFPSEDELYQYVDELAARIALFPSGGLNQTKSILGRSLNPSLALLDEDVNVFSELTSSSAGQTLVAEALAIERGDSAEAFELSLPEGVVQYLY